jgi:protein-S-isoprenylcysteine O-methyltransferase
MRRAPVVYALIGAYFAIERFLRQGAEARSLQAEAQDRESTRAIGQSFGVTMLSLLAAPLLNARGIGPLPGQRIFYNAGLVAMLTGLAIRIWATSVLGRFYTRTLRIASGQRLVREGPYATIRHPGYLGTLLVWLGAAAAMGNGVTLTVAGSVLIRAYLRRIDAEEAMLRNAYGEDYAEYSRRTSRLLPHVY